ncbi:TPA: hypothetical protein L4I40_003031 [Pseudomonas aeruginosa]|nr:hypothetical protein [Pseudomonas aeruginosa]
MTKANECTCPSGDGSLRHPCPAHPASVEQAGGDEREEFEAWMHTFDLPPQLDGETFADERYLEAACFGQFVYDDPLTQRCWAAWQARAALAQPSPKSGYYSDQEWINAGCPPEQPSPVQAEQAERAEVVARVVHSNPVVLDQCAPLNANDEMMTVAQHAASVARWAEMFNRVEQERDAALARVAELEKQDLVDVPGPDEIHQMAFEEGQPAEDGDGYLFSSEEFDLFVQRLLDSCAAPVAQAQHSVPEGFREKFKQCMELAFAEIALYVSPEKARNPNSRARKASALATELLDMLAAAPGKEVGHE